MLSTTGRLAVALCLATGLARPAAAWNAHGHRTVTLLALDRLPADAPAWLRDPAIRARVADQSNEADRWRGTRAIPIRHEVNPEHYIDIEDLEPFGLRLRELSPYRYEAFRAMVLAKAANPGAFPTVERDTDKSKEWPGFLPWAIQEHTAKLQASFHTYRVLEAIGDPERALQLEQARQNVIYQMGMLAHFVGDAAQPLHTTRHHHGWVGENPGGFTTEFGFHSYIDGTILAIHGLNYETLRPMMPAATPGDATDAWDAGLDAIERSFAQLEPLYTMERDRTLSQDPGKALIAERLCDAGATLGLLYSMAWEAGKPTDRDIGAYIKFSEMRTRQDDAPGGVEPGTELEAKPAAAPANQP